MKINKAIIMSMAAAMFMVIFAAATIDTESNSEANIPVLDVSGTVTDAYTGEGIPGAEVSLDEADLSATTDEFGTFNFTGVDAGSYTLTVDADGYDVREESVELNEENRTLRVELEPES